MAFNWQTFRTRALTALIFVAVMMFGLLYNSWSIFTLISVIHFGCWWEYLKLIEKIQKTDIHIYAKAGWCLLGYHIFLLLAGNGLQAGPYNVQQSFSLPFLIAGVVLLIWGMFKTNKVVARLLLWCFGGLLYIAVSLGLLGQLASGSNAVFPIPGAHLVLFIIGSVWINDTMAYLTGSVIGRTPLSKISPKKTWEGTLGGIVFSAALTWLLYSLIFLKHIDRSIMWTGISISATAAVVGTFGDLFESKLKRMAGVKDSGHIMPGHGGFLDRFDSVLFAGAAVWLLIRVAGYMFHVSG